MEEQVNSQQQIERLNMIVSRIFKIDDVTIGTTQSKFLVRYRGHLISEDSAAAYDQLAEQLKPLGITPLFRWDEKRHSIILIQGLPPTKPSRPWINLVLFIATIFSVLFFGAVYSYQGPLPSDPIQLILIFLKSGWPYAVSIIAILGSHELGHFLAGRIHGLNVSLPYFIPFPFPPLGTMGAFINLKDIPKNRRVLLDVGIAGPLSGLIVGIPILFLGLKLSTLSTLPAEFTPGTLSLEGNSVIYLLAKFLVYGQLLPAPVDFHGLPPLVYWISYFLSGKPLPLGGTDVMLGPVAWAAWGGLLVTGLNLIPAGQLDGGHILYMLFGEKVARKIYFIILAALGLLGFVWSGWWVWAILIYFLGRYYAEPLDLITELDRPRKILAAVTLVIFLLTFTPVPFIV